jgi:hypothetical protein
MQLHAHLTQLSSLSLLIVSFAPSACLPVSLYVRVSLILFSHSFFALVARHFHALCSHSSLCCQVHTVRCSLPSLSSLSRYSSASDAWAFGVTVWEIMSDAATPYGDEASLDVVAERVRAGG